MLSLRKNLNEKLKYYFDVINPNPENASFLVKAQNLLEIHSNEGRVRAIEIKTRLNSVEDESLLLQIYAEIQRLPASSRLFNTTRDMLIQAVYMTITNKAEHNATEKVTFSELNDALFKYLKLDIAERDRQSKAAHSSHVLSLAFGGGGYAAMGARQYFEFERDTTVKMITDRLKGNFEAMEKEAPENVCAFGNAAL